MKNIIFVNIPNSGGENFEKNFANRWFTFNNEPKYNYSVGVSWTYPTQIRGWRDWDFTIQTPGEHRDVDVFNLNDDDILISVVRNPFNLLYTYFKTDWADFKKFHNVDFSEDDTLNFQKFVDIYLNDSVDFHAPAFKKSLFSQLKDSDGNWIIDSDDILFKFEDLENELNKFSESVDLPIEYPIDKSNLYDIDAFDFYREDQIKKLNYLWKDDLEYFGYSTNSTSQPTTILETTEHPKIAICFSGHIRDLDRTKDYWTGMIKKYDMDVYASFWDVENKDLGDTMNNFLRIYDVKKVEVENYNSFHKSTLSQIQSIVNPPFDLIPQLQEATKQFGQLPMWYKVWKANMMTKELGVDYDIIIRARTDSFFMGDVTILDNGILNVPIGISCIPNWGDSYGINDIFAYGSPKVMDYYSSMFLYMMKYLNDGYYPFPPEHFLYVHMSKANTSIRQIPNYIVITRTSKGTDDEVYNSFVHELNDDIILTKDVQIEPSGVQQFVNPIGDI